MKRTILTLALAAITSLSIANDKGKASGNLKVNTSASTVEWTGKKVTGQHNGKIKLMSSDLTMKNGMIDGGKILIDMNSITVEDLQGEWGDKLKGHLLSEDFFATDKFKTAEFEIRSVKPIANANEGAPNHMISGDLTIKGITHPIEFPALITVKDNAVAAIGEATIDRTKYDIRYGSASFFESLGDKAISNDFTIKFKLAAKK
jgi:polyisoprenoid-binding protein YceI